MNKGRLRGPLLFLIACCTSPCCTPLIVPLLLTLMAGTPVAVWTSHYLGWVYGVLTVISLISLVLGLRWMGKRKPSQPAPLPRPELSDVSPVLEGENIHVEYAD